MDKGWGGPCSARGHPKMQDTVFAADCAPVMAAQNSANPVPRQQVSQGWLHTFRHSSLGPSELKPINPTSSLLAASQDRTKTFEPRASHGRPGWFAPPLTLVCPHFCW